jgi:DNA-directed RNA polymerase specialized sigma24 family protein
MDFSRVSSTFEAEFEALFSERWERLYVYLHRLTGDSDVASDVAQEAFVRLYRRGSLPADAGAWLVSVANNLLRDEGRKRDRRRKLLGLWSADAPVGAAAPDPVAEMEGAESREAVRARLAALTLQRDLELAARSLERLDGSVPWPSARALIERAHRETADDTSTAPAPGSVDPAPPAPLARRFPSRAAAAVALLVAASAAAALPGSPLRLWVIERFASDDAPAAPATIQPPPSSDGFGGVALPSHLPLLIVLPASVERGRVALAVADQDVTQVLASDPATDFSVGPSVLTLTTRADSLQIAITAPATMPRLVVRVGNRVVLDRDQPFATEAMARGDTLWIPLALSRP